MSSFYSRCLVCGIDLPRGCSFCGEMCRERWHAKHDGEPVARVMTDEWPLVERETVVSEAGERSSAVQAGNLGDSSPRDVGRGASIPTASPRTLYYDHKRVFPF